MTAVFCGRNHGILLRVTRPLLMGLGMRLVKDVDTQVSYSYVFQLKSLLIIICMEYMLNSIDISYLLEKVKDHSMLDGDKTILGINTLWSTLLPVAIRIHQYTRYQPCKYVLNT